jgi:Mn-dependent DtxR family transcriptional regulator
LLTEDDIAALQVLLVSRTLNLTDELLHSAAREIEAVMFERVIDRLRAALPDLVAEALREQLAPGED